MNKHFKLTPCGPLSVASKSLSPEYSDSVQKPSLRPSCPLTRLLNFGILVFLLASLTACASASIAPSDPPVPCPHPIVAVGSVGGLVQGLMDYADALDYCNALRGIEVSDVDSKG